MKKIDELTASSRETDWSKALAKELDGRAEERTLYGSRCDILVDKYAVEVERANGWAQSIGQSLLYASALGREPAVLLLVRDKDAEQEYIGRCAIACAKAGIVLTWIEMSRPRENLDEVIEVLNPHLAKIKHLSEEYKNAKKAFDGDGPSLGRYISTH